MPTFREAGSFSLLFILPHPGCVVISKSRPDSLSTSAFFISSLAMSCTSETFTATAKCIQSLCLFLEGCLFDAPPPLHAAQFRLCCHISAHQQTHQSVSTFATTTKPSSSSPATCSSLPFCASHKRACSSICSRSSNCNRSKMLWNSRSSSGSVMHSLSWNTLPSSKPTLSLHFKSCSRQDVSMERQLTVSAIRAANHKRWTPGSRLAAQDAQRSLAQYTAG
jgi:hypothetical protein